MQATQRVDILQLIDSRIAALAKCVPIKIDANFVWAIDQLAERTNGMSIGSGSFAIHKEPYKMGLRCEWRCTEGKEVRIYLGNYFANNTTVKWPFERRVTITITNEQCPRAYRAITNNCRISKGPKYDEYRYSDPFIFLYSDLSDVGLLLNNHLIVSCTIDDA